jgi:hypothetical protein
MMSINLRDALDSDLKLSVTTRLLSSSKGNINSLQQKNAYPKIHDIIGGITHAGQQLSTLGKSQFLKKKTKKTQKNICLTKYDPSLKVIQGVKFQNHCPISPEKKRVNKTPHKSASIG